MNNNVKISHKIDGKVIARALNQESSKRVKDFFKEHGYIPKLNVLWIGMDFVSRSYFNVIQKTSSEVGIRFYKSRFFPDVSQKTLEDEIKFLNEDKQISGYIMLLPLSQNLDVLALRAKMIESKDVDGMSLSTTQKIKDGLEPLFWPATALGCMEVIKNQFPGSLKGKTVTVVGLSDIVGMP
ncbi:MAG TPA: tetrahydrofolate dehydrogenase/cyclohydrolase catalytic domain-containing protein, partial [Candidatus Absconditabacterales bacterium]|nr:tetrahydrofolate dehydrogenase/cyclohydrolase catalytic domain-containing protein [Candidatus Absconditabacterales bacterium]